MSLNGSEFQLEARSALITGGSSGMGEEIGRHMAAAGAQVSLVGRNSERLKRVAESIKQHGGIAYTIVQDLTEEGAPQAVVEFAVERMGSLDILANVAGIFETAPFENTTIDSLDRQFATNVRIPFLLTQEALPYLRQSGRGAVLFISSMAALAAFPEASAYSASKGAIESLSRELSAELASDGIRVNTIAPGEIDTPMNTEFYKENPDWVEYMKEFTPAGRLGLATDIASVAVFLASDAARFIYGVSVPVDGGVIAK